MFAQNGREKKKKVVKLHGKPFIRLKLFPLATRAFTTCNQKKVNQKSNTIFLLNSNIVERSYIKFGSSFLYRYLF